MRALFDEFARGLGWSGAEQILMVWAYYDESGEYDAAGTLLNMSIGGCIARRDKWEKLDAGWRKVLGDEGIPAFHMTDFEAWASPFDFKLESGERDKARHNRILNALLDLMIEHIEGYYGYASVSKYEGRELTHRSGMQDCVGGAVKDVVLRAWESYEEPINLVFAKQKHFPANWVNKFVEIYDYGNAKGRVGSVSHCDADKLPALQAADILAYEVARSQRANRPERYPFGRLVAAAKDRRTPFSLTWGPLRSKRLNLSGEGVSWG